MSNELANSGASLLGKRTKTYHLAAKQSQEASQLVGRIHGSDRRYFLVVFDNDHLRLAGRFPPATILMFVRSSACPRFHPRLDQLVQNRATPHDGTVTPFPRWHGIEAVRRMIH
jgi:hypothetical protein